MVRSLPSVSVALRVISLEVSSEVVTLISSLTGASFTAVMVMDTVAVLLSSVPSLALYVNESLPL